MALCTLLHKGQSETFAFEHQMAHRELLGSMSPLTDFSVIPYLLTPGTNDGGWHQDHQQAHTDYTFAFPGWYGNPFRLEGTPGIGIIGPGYNIQDVNLTNPDELTWWTFQNHYAHLDAQTIQNPVLWTWPFW